MDLGPCATCRGAVVGIHRGGARGPGSRGGAWGRNRRWKVRELRGARRGHINRLAEHPRHPVVSRIVLIVVMAMTRDMPERKAICDGLVPGFDYLEARITGTCDAQYSLVGMYELCDLVRVFDPNFATAHANPALLNRMSVITPLNALDMLDGMKQELPLYLAAGGL